MKKDVAKLVARERVGRVATAGQAGMPHVVPVCHVVADGKVYFASEGKARKVRNLRVNAHAAITVDLYAEQWSHLKGVMIQGTTKLIDGGPRFRKVCRMLYEKYPQYPEEAALGKGDVIVELTPTHIFTWGLG